MYRFSVINNQFDIAIIGGGVCGSALAYMLSQYNIRVVVFEKGLDVACKTSKANSGVVHSGINSPPGSLKARFCVEGNKQFQELSDKLCFQLQWVGKYVVAQTEHEEHELKQLFEVGKKNNVNGLELLDYKQVHENEPRVNCVQGLWVPSAGIVLPYEVTIAFAEFAAVNSVTFLLDHEVTGLQYKKDVFFINTLDGVFEAKIVINTAGLSCKDIVEMLEPAQFNIFPCRGEYLILDKNYKNLISSMIYPVPVKELGVLGIHITPTIEGNILLGPSAEFIEDAEDVRTTKNMMDALLSDAQKIVPDIPYDGVISGYAGVRCKLVAPDIGGWADFSIHESNEYPGFISLIGIESPGLTAAPALAQHLVENHITNHVVLEEKQKVKPYRLQTNRFTNLPMDYQSKLFQQDDCWGRIICRCEHITEKEVIQALNNPLGAQTLSSVKYRCRAGMGRCQGGFCTQHIIRIMEKHYKLDPVNIKLKTKRSNMFTKRTREEQS